MFTFETQIDVMAEPKDVFDMVGDLMQRGHFFPSSVMAVRELEPRPFSATDRFLPGQRIAFLNAGSSQEHVLVEAQEWENAEASIVERSLRSAKNEQMVWRLSELTPGTVRVTIQFSADYGAFERLSKGSQMRKFWQETLQRLKGYLEDKTSFAGPRSFAPKPK